MTNDTPSSSTERSSQGQFVSKLSTLPWWVIILAVLGLILLYNITTNQDYIQIFGKLISGVWVTVYVTAGAYVMALLIGLIAGLGRTSKNPVLYNLATLYVQIIRGVPVLVQIFYVALVIVPLVINWLGFNPRNFDFSLRAMVALAVAYGGFEAETFRAGIQSIGRGQMEAARSLGMSNMQAMRTVILPQALRRMLPPLGNDFISMLKDSSLVSVLGVDDITNQGRKYAAASFRFPETYNSLAFIYLTMTLLLSLGVKYLETRLGEGGKG